MYKYTIYGENNDKVIFKRKWCIFMSKKIKKTISISGIIILSITIGIFFIYNIFVKNNEVEALSKYGSRGAEVTQIQTRLKRWGYYTGNVDGIYGTQTVNAVKYFQRKNGLAVDGIAGTKTLAAMGITSSSSSGSSSNSSNVNLLARLVYGEARGEPYTRTSSSSSSCIK